MTAYWQKLKDPRWQKKRLLILQRDGFACRQCKATDRELHVHHCAYQGEPWEAHDSTLLTLCAKCHERRGEVEKDIRRALATVMGWMSIEQLDRLLGDLETVGSDYCTDLKVLGFAPNKEEAISVH